MVRARRTDANHKQIVQALRAIGATVLDLSRVGQGAPDIACGYRGQNFFLELKTESGKLTPAQEDFRAMWRGHWAVARTAHEAVLIVAGGRN